MVISLERGADLHMAQLIPLPLTVSCLSKIQIGFTFLVPAHLGSPGKRALKRVCVCVCDDFCDHLIHACHYFHYYKDCNFTTFCYASMVYAMFSCVSAFVSVCH